MVLCAGLKTFSCFSFCHFVSVYDFSAHHRKGKLCPLTSLPKDRCTTFEKPLNLTADTDTNLTHRRWKILKSMDPDGQGLRSKRETCHYCDAVVLHWFVFDIRASPVWRDNQKKWRKKTATTPWQVNRPSNAWICMKYVLTPGPRKRLLFRDTHRERITG